MTVLFADLKGSMDLSESVDPEDWHRIMERTAAISGPVDVTGPYRILPDARRPRPHHFDGEAELRHAMRHFTLPRDLVLSLIQRVLEKPTIVLVDDSRAAREYRMFYRLEDGRYLLAVVKVTVVGPFFASLYDSAAYRDYPRDANGNVIWSAP